MKVINNKIKLAIQETDLFLLFLCLVTSCFGVLMVHSATLSEAEGAFSRDTRTMLLAVGLGICCSIIISFIDFKLITKLYPIIGGVCILLMILTLIIGVGPNERQDAKTWIMIGSTGLYFQPSELVKIGFAITFAMHIEQVGDDISRLRTVLGLCLHGLVPTGLVVISGDMGSALVFIAMFAAVMFCAGLKKRYIFTGIALVTALAPVIWTYVFSDTQKNRILGLIYPDLYKDIMYQQTNGLNAILSGKVTGKGLFNGYYTSNGIIPESENDMIFTCIGEQLGLIGALAALALILLIVLRIIRNGRVSSLQSTSSICIAIAAMIASQTVINIGMCLRIFPVVGITLPFFSAGGSSNLCIYIGIGLILSIYRYEKERSATDFRVEHITSKSIGG